MQDKLILKKIKLLLLETRGQALTEYIMVIAFIGMAMIGVFGMMKWPVAGYLKNILEAIATTR